MTPALQWTQRGDHWRARCGSHEIGIVLVRRHREGWTFVLDMLPGDSEPVVRGDAYLTPDRAMAQAELQVQQWPRLIEGAVRL